MHPEIPEGINVSKTHPLADFGLMLAGALGIIILVFIAAHLLASVMVRFVSFETETKIFDQSPLVGLVAATDSQSEKAIYLQSLADQLSANMSLPEDISVRVHYSAEDIPNAFATLGGHIVIYQGLIDEVSSENGLAMVIAHEVAHIKHRDPIMALGRGTVSMIGLLAITGFSDSSVVGNIAGTAGLGVLSNYSRKQEKRADREAVAALRATYGTLAGADEFFIAVSEDHQHSELDFFATHPPTQDRIDRIQAESNKAQSGETSLTPLPEFLTTKDD